MYVIHTCALCCIGMFSLGLEEASKLLRGLQENLLLSPVVLYFKGLLFRCKV